MRQFASSQRRRERGYRIADVVGAVYRIGNSRSAA